MPINKNNTPKIKNNIALQKLAKFKSESPTSITTGLIIIQIIPDIIPTSFNLFALLLNFSSGFIAGLYLIEKKESIQKG